MKPETNLMDAQEATCVVNSHGRLLSANSRFCRMFGFESDEPEWHYLADLYRHEEEWNQFRTSTAHPEQERHFLARMRNRKGRSFKCKITRRAEYNPSGDLVFVNTIAKIVSARDMQFTHNEGFATVAKQVFWIRCSACARVRDGEGHWIEPAAANRVLRSSHRSEYCPECAAKIFPGVFDKQAHNEPAEELLSAVH